MYIIIINFDISSIQLNNSFYLYFLFFNIDINIQNNFFLSIALEK
jgi:hypothetical protein